MRQLFSSFRARLRLWPSLFLLFSSGILLWAGEREAFEHFLMFVSFVGGVFSCAAAIQLFRSQSEFRKSAFGPAISSLIITIVFGGLATILILYARSEIREDVFFYWGMLLGILSPKWKDNRLETVLKSEDSDSLGRECGSPVSNLPSSSYHQKKQVGDHTFHLCVYTPKREDWISPDPLENTAITARVKEVLFDDDSITFESTIYPDHDPLTSVEIASAIFWREKINSGILTIDSATNGLSNLQSVTGTKYQLEKFSHTSSKDDITFYGLLCSASLHTFVAFLHVEHQRQDAAVWFRSEYEKNGTDFRWFCHLGPAERIRDMIDPKLPGDQFVQLLLESAGIRLSPATE